MERRYHNLLNALVREAHPFPNEAVRRAIYADKRNLKGAGLTKIPLSVFREEESSKSQAQRVYDSVDDSIDVEAAYLSRRDTELEATLGFETALSYYYADEDVDENTDNDIINTELNIKLAPDIPSILLPDESIPREFKGIFDEVKRVFSDDTVRGYDRADSDRKRITNQLRNLIEKIGENT